MDYSFIDTKRLSSMAECSAIVCMVVQSLKYLMPCNPILIAFLASITVSSIRLFIDKDLNKESILLAIINIFPIFLSACGAYDTIKFIFK